MCVCTFACAHVYFNLLTDLNISTKFLKNNGKIILINLLRFAKQSSKNGQKLWEGKTNFEYGRKYTLKKKKAYQSRKMKKMAISNHCCQAF